FCQKYCSASCDTFAGAERPAAPRVVKSQQQEFTWTANTLRVLQTKPRAQLRRPLGKLQGTRSCRPKASSIGKRLYSQRRGRCQRRFIEGRLICKLFKRVAASGRAALLLRTPPRRSNDRSKTRV